MARQPDPLAALALAMSSAPGRYALLLGSGISVGAGVPTGWAVVKELALKLAVAAGESPSLADPIGWYKEAHGDDPDYSGLLEAVGPTAPARQELLAEYFRPDPDDPGAMQPSRAHRAIARLVQKGLVRVIVTTNFDRLTEQALQEAGIDPIVVANEEAAAGTVPLAHTPFTLIKVHGDYLDPNIRNTVGELSRYGTALDALLDRVFDDYGIIVAGWSADWDPALRSAIERCPSRRYGTYWAARGNLTEQAGRLLAHRGGVSIPIEDADNFFEGLANTTESLAEMRSSPTTIGTTVAKTKKWLPDPVHRIRLDDLATTAVEVCLESIPDPNPAEATNETYLSDVRLVEEASAELVSILSLIAAWADRPDHISLLERVFERLAGPMDETTYSGLTAWRKLRNYPFLLAVYAAGLGAVHARNWPTIASVLTVRGTNSNGTEGAETVAARSLSWHVLEENPILEAYHQRKVKTPTSSYLHDQLGSILRESLRIDSARFEDLFDEWEFLLQVVAVDQQGFAPYGRWTWRTWHQLSHVPRGAADAARTDLSAAGLFDSEDRTTSERYEEVVESYLKSARESFRM